MARLPKVGGDTGNWGDILNAFLGVSHNSDGSLRSSTLSSAGAEMSSNKDSDTSLTANSNTKYPTQKAVKTYVDDRKNIIDTIGNLPSSGADGQTFYGTDTGERWVWSSSDSAWKLMNTPIVKHVWDKDGTTGWTRQPISTDSPNGPTTLSVVSGRGRISSSVSDTALSYREVWLRDGTNWEDSEICSLWWGCDRSVTTPPQMGHMHRAQHDGNGNWTSVMVDNNVVFNIYSTLNLTPWAFNGTTLTQGTGGQQMTSLAQIPRWYVQGYRRVNFGGYLDQYKLDHVDRLSPGDSVTVAGCDDTSFNITATIASIDTANNQITLAEPTSTTAVSWTSQIGGKATVTPAIPTQKYWPFWVKSRCIGTKLKVKVWHYNEHEPAWGEKSDNEISMDFSGTSITVPTGNGYCGIIANHLHDGIYMEYGDVSMRRL